jgi:hypothetical protein
MNEKTAGNRSLRRAGALAVAAAVAVLATACGGSAPSPSASAPTHPQVLALAQCMRSHGEPNFPDPDQSDQSPASGSSPAFNPSSPQFQAASTACQHLLPAGAHLSIHGNASTS